jgi:hypothetical protein
VSSPTPHKPVLCRLNMHKWVPSVNADFYCLDCGKIAESPADLDRARWRLSQRLSRGDHGLVDFCWVPDPTGTHELRLTISGGWTSMVVTAGVLRSDTTLSGPASFDWTGPAPAPIRSTPSEWLPAGTYVFRSKWQPTRGFSQWYSAARPAWYSAVWTQGRPIFLIEDEGQRFTVVDNGTSYPAARRRLAPRPHFGDGGFSIRIRTTLNHPATATLNQPATENNDDVIDSATGTVIASTYSVANQPPTTKSGDHTVVITVPNAILMRLGLLVLSYATRKMPFIREPNGMV